MSRISPRAVAALPEKLRPRCVGPCGAKDAAAANPARFYCDGPPWGGGWIEEYQPCGCSAEFPRMGEALGYCATHGGDRKRLFQIPRRHCGAALCLTCATPVGGGAGLDNHFCPSCRSLQFESQREAMRA